MCVPPSLEVPNLFLDAGIQFVSSFPRDRQLPSKETTFSNVGFQTALFPFEVLNWFLDVGIKFVLYSLLIISFRYVSFYILQFASLIEIFYSEVIIFFFLTFFDVYLQYKKLYLSLSAVPLVLLRLD